MSTPLDVTGDPVALVRAYLAAMERRDLDAARAMLAPGFRMTFPGDTQFNSLEELVASAKGRYRSASKTFEHCDVVPQADGSAVVYCLGTLFGDLNSGEAYAGIRYIDRFTVRGGRLVDQRVWNDMAEVLGAKLKPL